MEKEIMLTMKYERKSFWNPKSFFGELVEDAIEVPYERFKPLFEMGLNKVLKDNNYTLLVSIGSQWFDIHMMYDDRENKLFTIQFYESLHGWDNEEKMIKSRVKKTIEKWIEKQLEKAAEE